MKTIRVYHLTDLSPPLFRRFKAAQIVHAFLANVETTRTLRREHQEMLTRYPWRTKRFYPVKWPAQAVHKEKRRSSSPGAASARSNANAAGSSPKSTPDAGFAWDSTSERSSSAIRTACATGTVAGATMAEWRSGNAAGTSTT
jgi:hypothetical protein